MSPDSDVRWHRLPRRQRARVRCVPPKQHAICQQYCPGYTSLAHGAQKTLQQAGLFFGGDYRTERFTFPLRYTQQKFIACSPSSYAPERGSEQYEVYLRALQALWTKHLRTTR